MKCLVFSDSHGDGRNIRLALKLHKNADAVFFLGDGLRDAEAHIDGTKTWFFVRGNCDFKSDIMGSIVPKLDEVVLAGRKIVYTHGDMYGVKLSDDGLLSLAEGTGADIVLYGHTHRAREDYKSVCGRGVYFFNPGSVSGINSRASYGILDIDENNVLFSIADIAIC